MMNSPPKRSECTIALPESIQRTTKPDENTCRGIDVKALDMEKTWPFRPSPNYTGQ